MFLIPFIIERSFANSTHNVGPKRRSKRKKKTWASNPFRKDPGPEALCTKAGCTEGPDDIVVCPKLCGLVDPKFYLGERDDRITDRVMRNWLYDKNEDCCTNLILLPFKLIYWPMVMIPAVMLEGIVSCAVYTWIYAIWLSPLAIILYLWKGGDGFSLS